MPLELEKPDLSEDDLPLTLVDIQAFHAEFETYINGRVTELRQQYPGLPPGTIRQTLAKGSQCLCLIATRMLKEELKQ